MRIEDSSGDETLYKVLVDAEARYSIWPADRENPLGWGDAGRTGVKAECLGHIAQVRSGMRPGSPDDSLDLRVGVPERDPEAGPEAGPDRPGCPMGR